MSFQYLQPQPEPEKKAGISPVLLIVGAIILILVIICGIGALVIFVLPMLSGPGGGTPVVSAGAVSYDIPTARDAYVSAVDLIRQQDAGAQLASAAGAWTPVINRAQLSNGRTGWTFAFYLPSTHQMVSVIANGKTGARIADAQPWGTPPALLDDQNWKIDSGNGMPSFLQQCQGALDAQPDSWVEARLTTVAENGRLLWQYQVLAPDLTVLCEVRIDATTGQVR